GVPRNDRVITCAVCPGMYMRSCFLIIAIVFALAYECAPTAFAQTAPTAATTLDAAVKQLTAEADNLFPVKLDAKDPPQFTRPNGVAIGKLIGKPGAAID